MNRANGKWAWTREMKMNETRKAGDLTNLLYYSEYLETLFF